MVTIDPAEWLRNERRYFMNVVKDFKPEHAEFRPAPEMMTVAQQIRHVALTVGWFHEGAFGSGFDLDFAKAMAEMFKPCGFEEAIEMLRGAYDRFLATLEGAGEDKLNAGMPPNPILGELPRVASVFACSDHTAHHRGSLAVYLRLLGLTPAIPYME